VSELEVCKDCGVALPSREGPTHPYLGASASCWALYGDVLAREYSDPHYMRVHRLTVDAYAAQHPGKPERRSIQSVWVHLTGLFLVLEKRLPDHNVRRVMSLIAKGAGRLHWLEPPTRYGCTVRDVSRARDAAAHAELVRQWAEDVWHAWGANHAAVRSFAENQLAYL
jgi:hypothetical protein